jgi:hypothetical protein
MKVARDRNVSKGPFILNNPINNLQLDVQLPILSSIRIRLEHNLPTIRIRYNADPDFGYLLNPGLPLLPSNGSQLIDFL